MAQTFRSASRRSERLLRSLPVVVCGESKKQKPFREEALTIEFSAHGMLLLMYERPRTGQKLLLLNPSTWDEQDASVVHSSPFHDGLHYVGIEFARPAPEFWPVIPLEDWTNATNNSMESSNEQAA